MGMITVLLADDHPAFREGVRAVLDRHDDITVVGEASSGADTLDEVAAHSPDVLLLDMELPDMSGLEVARAIRERGDSVCVLPLSGFTDSEYVLGCLDAGASGYLTKDTPIETLVEAIRTVYRGGVYVSPRTAVDIVRERQRKISDDERIRLLCEDMIQRGISPRLFRILQLVAEGLSNSDIAEREFRSEHTVRNQVERIKSALGVRWRPALVAWAWRNGIRDIDETTFDEIHHRA